MTRARPLALSVAATLLIATGACRAPEPGVPIAAREAAAVQSGLQGAWRLVDWRPDVPLEPTLQAWLDQSRSNLVVRFADDASAPSLGPGLPHAGGRLSAQALSLSYERPYTVSDVAGSRFRIATTNASGVTFVTSCELTGGGKNLLFQGETAPFRGGGLLERVGP